MPNKYDRRLGYVAIFLAMLSIGNGIDFLFVTKNNFTRVKGKVTNVDATSFFGNTRSTRRTYYTKTAIEIDNRHKKYYAIEKTNEDSLLLTLKIGDEIEVYVKKWYQYISYIGVNANIFFVKKDGDIIYDIIYRCRRANKMFMIIFGSMSLFFTIIYLDVVKNISLENWFQKRILKNKDYL